MAKLQKPTVGASAIESHCLMLLSPKVLPCLPCQRVATFQRLDMTLQALWSRLSQRSAQSSLPMRDESPAVAVDHSLDQLPDIRQKRKRSSDFESQQNKLHKKTPAIVPAGAADLGSGSIILFHPSVFEQPTTRQIYKVLKVRAAATHAQQFHKTARTT